MTTGAHSSDDPGGPEGRRREGHGAHPSSGVGPSSLPRRGGTGERQAPRSLYTGDRPHEDRPLVPGEVLYGDDPVVINAGKDVVTVRVANTGDRPVQVGSHYHFAEVNPALEFDRELAWGRRLNVLSGGSVRFEPGALAEVQLVPIGGQRLVAGLRGECGGELDG